jgi:2-methylisocitrate lyase-like PEP mutase family enzyme
MRPRAAALKALLDQPGLQIMPVCGDGMGARLIEEAGFRTGFVSGSSIAAMRLAMRDMDLLIFPEMADAVETVIFAAPNVLWLADGDTGYGKALAVQKTIRAYARRGAAAVLIEDKVWPRPLGRGGAKLVIERDAALLRCRAAPPRRHVARRASCDPGYFPASEGGASARGSQSSTVVPSPTLLRIRIAPRD